MLQRRLHIPSLGRRRTKPIILYEILSDRRWHSTRELSRRVGHTFAMATYLLRRNGHVIARERHLDCRYQFRYRLLDPANKAGNDR